MFFELSVRIRRPPEDVFDFLRDKDRYPQEPGSPVLALEKTTPGETSCALLITARSFRWRPLFAGSSSLRSRDMTLRTSSKRTSRELACRDILPTSSPRILEAPSWSQRETLDVLGPLKIVSPMIQYVLARQLRKRLDGIRDVLDSGREVGSSS